MDNDYSDLIGGTNPLLETVEGTYSCQRGTCDGYAFEAQFNSKTTELVWTCQFGHKSYVEECRWL